MVWGKAAAVFALFASVNIAAVNGGGGAVDGHVSTVVSVLYSTYIGHGACWPWSLLSDWYRKQVPFFISVTFVHTTNTTDWVRCPVTGRPGHPASLSLSFLSSMLVACGIGSLSVSSTCISFLFVLFMFLSCFIIRTASRFESALDGVAVL